MTEVMFRRKAYDALKEWKTDPIVSVTAHRRDGSSESVDAAVEIDTRRNVKITYDERMHCTVKISERNGEA